MMNIKIMIMMNIKFMIMTYIMIIIAMIAMVMMMVMMMTIIINNYYTVYSRAVARLFAVSRLRIYSERDVLFRSIVDWRFEFAHRLRWLTQNLIITIY